MLKQLNILGFKEVGDLQISLQEHWNVLVGPGSSQVLRALALGLAPKDFMYPRPFQPLLGSAGRVELQTEESLYVTDLTAHKRVAPRRSGDEFPGFVYAFGEPKSFLGSPTYNPSSGNSLRSLWDRSFKHSLGGGEWLRLLAYKAEEDPDRYQEALSCLETAQTILQPSYALRSLAEGPFGPFDAWEDLEWGAQTLLGMMLSILKIKPTGTPAKTLRGVVLIERLETYLSPHQQLLALPFLRSVFPHLQFVVTTESPLVFARCLPGQVHSLIPNGEGGVCVGPPQDPRCQGLADLFDRVGVSRTVVSPYKEALDFYRFYGRKSQLTPEQEEQLETSRNLLLDSGIGLPF